MPAAAESVVIVCGVDVVVVGVVVVVLVVSGASFAPANTTTPQKPLIEYLSLYLPSLCR